MASNHGTHRNKTFLWCKVLIWCVPWFCTSHGLSSWFEMMAWSHGTHQAPNHGTHQKKTLQQCQVLFWCLPWFGAFHGFKPWFRSMAQTMDSDHGTHQTLEPWYAPKKNLNHQSEPARAQPAGQPASQLSPASQSQPGSQPATGRAQPANQPANKPLWPSGFLCAPVCGPANTRGNLNPFNSAQRCLHSVDAPLS